MNVGAAFRGGDGESVWFGMVRERKGSKDGMCVNQEEEEGKGRGAGYR